MAKALKVWVGTVVVTGGKQYKVVIAASSKAKASAVAGESLYSFTQHWSETGNEEDRAVALANPYKRWGRPLDGPRVPMVCLDN